MSATPANANRALPVLSVMLTQAELWDLRPQGSTPAAKSAVTRPSGVRGSCRSKNSSGSVSCWITPRTPRPQPRSGCSCFIPAHAGNTRSSTCRRIGRSVHPRARGEHGNRIDAPESPYGSSPRTRGTRFVCERCAVLDRFIPAHAGNTSASRRPRTLTPVHPRARGEHHRCRVGAVPWLGSSPRTRGTRAGPRSLALIARFIPAHAGNTARRC